MRTFVIIGLLTIICAVCHAQVNFQPGYYIRNDGSRVSCLIKDYGWLNNPTDIYCKSSTDDAPVTLVMDSIMEFGVGNVKYQRFTVDMEITGITSDQLTASPEPQFRQVKTFLKLLLEGRASLYLYVHKGIERYFYRLNGGTPKPLVSKPYQGADGVVHVNKEFTKVLGDSLTCSASDSPDPTSVNYEARSLTHYFIAYNTCVKSPFTDYFVKSSKTLFRLYIRPGIDISSLNMTNRYYYPGTTYAYGSRTSFRIGAEAELVLPFNRNKWAIVLEPEFRSYQSSSGGPGYTVDYKAIQALLGGRYYFFLGPQSKLYLTAQLFTDFQLHSTMLYEGGSLNMAPRFSGAFSAGFRFRDRFGLELQYDAPQPILDNYTVLRANLSGISAIFSFRIL